MGFADCLRKLDEDKKRDIRDFVDAYIEERRESPPIKATDFVRASGMYKFCPRREAYRFLMNLDASEVIEAKLARIFSFGRMFERYYRDEVMGPLGIVIGKWECVRCGHVPETGLDGSPRYPMPKTCDKCLVHAFRYQEEEFTDHGAMIRGHCDGFVYWANDYAILEMKTCNDRRFKMVTKSGKPMDDHYTQAQVYMRLSGYKKTLFWYINKNTSDDYTVWVDADPSYQRMLWDRAYELREFFKSQTLPKRVCMDCKVELAAACPLRNVCFELKES